MDDDELDYWFNASEEECRREDARLDAMMVELDRRLSSMTLPQQVAHHRHFLLKDLLKNRERLRTPELCTIDCITQMWRDSIKRCQVRLVKLRSWRATGIYPGAA